MRNLRNFAAKQKQLMIGIVLLLLAVLFIFFPHPASDLYLRVTFEEFTGDGCALYYTTDTDGNYSQDKCITSELDPDTMQVTFCLPGELSGHLTGLRLDFPHAEQLLCIKTATVSSAGVIKKEFNPCYLFVPENIQMNHNADITTVLPRNLVYVSAGSDDPFLIFSDAMTAQIEGFYSHQVLSRLCVCLFLAGCIFFAHKKLFTASADASAASDLTQAA